MYQQPDVLEDYSYRAIYTGGVVGKEVVGAFYGNSVTKSYFMGCSGGGRQGFKMANSFPEVFDGIVAGAPAINFYNLISFGGWLSTKPASTRALRTLLPSTFGRSFMRRF